MFLGKKAGREIMDELHEELRKRRKELRGSIKQKQRTQKKQEHERHVASKWEELRQWGDTLLAQKEQVPKGIRSYKTTNIHTGEPADIPLNPKCSAMRNSELLYKKARKGERGYEICCEKEAKTREEIELLTEELSRLQELIENPDETEAIRTYLESSARTEHKPNPSTKKEPPSLPYRKFTHKGWNIYAGKTATMNDELSTRFANPSDIWLHAVGYTGSHVIIRRNKNSPWPPAEILDLAGGIAVFYSKAKHTSYAEVHITEARFVRKPRKSPPGLVTAQRCKTKRVSPVNPQNFFKNS
nr:NFACT RNA binding domain-containing protein [Chitinivibrio alkaliphilus]